MQQTAVPCVNSTLLQCLEQLLNKNRVHARLSVPVFLPRSGATKQHCAPANIPLHLRSFGCIDIIQSRRNNPFDLGCFSDRAFPNFLTLETKKQGKEENWIWKTPRYQQDLTEMIRQVWYCLVWYGTVKMVKVLTSEPTVCFSSFFPPLYRQDLIKTMRVYESNQKYPRPFKTI